MKKRIKKQKALKLTSLFLVLVLVACTHTSDAPATELVEESMDASPLSSTEHPELFRLIEERDSVLFQVGFNHADTLQIAPLISEDFEFYHDEHGVTDSKEAFLNSITAIGTLPFRTWRTLQAGSMEIFPMYTNNKKDLYGILQTGIHEFYQQEEGAEARKTSTARFSHLWVLEDGVWKLKRVFSYDH